MKKAQHGEEWTGHRKEKGMYRETKREGKRAKGEGSRRGIGKGKQDSLLH